MNEEPMSPRPIRPALVRIVAAIAVALAFALGVYLLLEAVRPELGLISFSFLLILPAAISAFVCYVADPWKERSHRDYLLIPFYILLIVIVTSLVFLREGVICVLILSPLWAGSGAAGATIAYRLRRRQRTGNDPTYCTALLILPLLAMQIEPMIPLPIDTHSVTRSIVINASPDAIWPLA